MIRSDFVQILYSSILSGLIVLGSTALCGGVSSASSFGPLLALDFDNGNALEGKEADEIGVEESIEDHPLNLENESGEIRETRRWAAAVSLGESFPGVSVGILALKTINEGSALRLALARGQRRFTGQSAAGRSLSRNSVASYLDAGYEMWPAQHFPFVFSVGSSLGDIQGSAIAAGAESEQFRLRALGLSAEIVFENFFENGVWIRWVLLSGRYAKVISGRYGDLDGDAMSQVRNDHDGLQITGFANVSAGFSW
jgi:hypothetical protein